MEGEVKEKAKRLDKLEQELYERERKWNAIEMLAAHKQDVEANADIIEKIRNYVDNTPNSIRVNVGMINQSSLFLILS